MASIPARRRVGDSCPHAWLDNGLPQSDSKGRLLCPTCGSDNVHLGHVVVDQIGHEEISGPTNGVELRAHDCNRRGSLSRTRFLCESGHGFWLQFAFHKGSVYVGYEEFPFSVGPWTNETLRRS